MALSEERQAATAIDLGSLVPIIDLRSTLRRDEMRGAIRKRALTDINYLVVHHSAVAVDSSAEAIAAYHIDHNGWPGIGYHFLIHWDGRIEYVADISEIRYNVASRNHEVVGICLVGNWMAESPPDPALHSARTLTAALRAVLGRELPLVGHRDIALPGHGTACPGDTWPNWQPEVASGTSIVYTVQPGDTLWSIAQRFGTTVELLARINGLPDPNRISSGQTLIIRQGATRYHTVQPGDTLYAIARRYGATVPLLLRLNPWITNANLIHPGQVVALP